MKKITAVLLALLLITAFVGCKENTSIPNESNNSEALSQPEFSQAQTSESSVPSNQTNISEIKCEYNEKILTNGNILATPKGSSSNERAHYIATLNGEIVKTFVCMDMNLFPANENLLVVRKENSAFFVDANGAMNDSNVWNALYYWEEAPWEHTAVIGQLGDEFFALDSSAQVLMQISTEPEIVSETNGIHIVKAFNRDNYYYGVMNDGKYIIEPIFTEAPFVINNLIFANNNALDVLSCEICTYDFSGRLLKQEYGFLRMRDDSYYMIKFRRYNKDSEEGEYSILDYSFRPLYTAEKGIDIDFDYISAYSDDINPHRVRLDGESVLLATLIKGSRYSPILTAPCSDASDLSPKELTVLQTPYVDADDGKHYVVTDELKNRCTERLLRYLELAGIEFEENRLSYEETYGYFHVYYTCDDMTIYADHESLSVQIAKREILDPLAEPVVQLMCKMLFDNNQILKIAAGTNGSLFWIYEDKNTPNEDDYSRLLKFIYIWSYNRDVLTFTATDRTDDNIYPKYTLKALSCEEATMRLRKGDFKKLNDSYRDSYLNFSYKDGDIEVVQFRYVLKNECICEECYYTDYYIPCYCFYIRDTNDPEYYIKLYVPAIDIDEFNEYLTSVSQPTVNHFWTEE